MAVLGLKVIALVAGRYERVIVAAVGLGASIKPESLGRSLGCPAVSTAVARPLIDSIRGGSFVFAYYPDPAWLKQSRLLSADCGSGVAARPVSSAAGR